MNGAADLQVDVALVAADDGLAALGEVVERRGGILLGAAGLAAQVVDRQPHQQPPLASVSSDGSPVARLTYSLGAVPAGWAGGR